MRTCNYSDCSYVQVACKPCTDSHSQTAGLKYRSLTKAWRNLLLFPTSWPLGWQLPCLSMAGSRSCRFSLCVWGFGSFSALGAVGRVLLAKPLPLPTCHQAVLCSEQQQVHGHRGLCSSTRANVWNSEVQGLALTAEFCFLQLENASVPFWQGQYFTSLLRTGSKGPHWDHR